MVVQFHAISEDVANSSGSSSYKKGSAQKGYNDIRPTKNCHLLQLRPFPVPWAFYPGFI